MPAYPTTPACPKPVTYTTKKWKPSSYGKTKKRLAHKGELRQTGSGKFAKLVTFTSESKRVSSSRFGADRGCRVGRHLFSGALTFQRCRLLFRAVSRVIRVVSLSAHLLFLYYLLIF